MAFSYYKQLTIQSGQVPSSQSNFPVLLPFLGGDTDIKNHARSDGFDIRPYSDSGLTSALAFELVSYNSSTGAFEMWVNMTAADGNVVYLAYGDAGVTTDGSSTSTWNSNFLLVSHLSKDGSTLSTVNSKTGGTGRSDNPVATTSPYSLGAQNSTGSSTFLAWDGTSPSSASVDLPSSTDFALSMWYYKATANVTTSLFQIFIGALGTLPGGVSRFGGHFPYIDNNFYWDAGDPSNGRVSTSYASYLDGWHRVVLVSKADNSFGAIYIDGVKKATRFVGNHPASALNGAITPYEFAGSGSDIAKFDEIYYETSVRSDDWWTTEYNNQFAPTSFWSTGSETPVGGGGGAAFVNWPEMPRPERVVREILSY